MLTLCASVENSEMFGNLSETSLNYLFHTVKAFISLSLTVRDLSKMEHLQILQIA